jgi:hypothetical protein
MGIRWLINGENYDRELFHHGDLMVSFLWEIGKPLYIMAAILSFISSIYLLGVGYVRCELHGWNLSVHI